jgi:hypothetical protein
MGYQDSMNLYQAFNMNPVNFVDPLGLYDSNFHYYVIYLLMRYKGWEHKEAHSVASWSEMVDMFGKTDSFSVDFSKVRFFHFPGSNPKYPTMRNDRQSRIKVGKYSKEFITDKIENAIKLGVFLHIYSDSWAHEGFTAWPNSVINNRGHIFPRPSSGHANAPLGGHAPDVITLDEESKQKTMEAAKFIFDLLPSGKGEKISWEVVENALDWAFELYTGNMKDADWEDLQQKEIKRLRAVIKSEFGISTYFNPSEFEKHKNIYYEVLKEYGLD